VAADVDAGLSLNNLFRLEVLANPYPFYRELRCREPVHWDRYRNAWVLTRYADVVSVLNDARFTAARWGADADWLPENDRATLGPAYLALVKEMVFTDPPDHTRARGLVGRALAGWVGAAMRPRVEQLAHGLLDAVGHLSGMDAIRDLAYTLPFLVMAEILGIPLEDRDEVRKWSDAHAKLISLRWDELHAGVQGFHHLLEYFRDAVARRRASPGKDLIRALIAAENLDDAPGSEELLANCALVLTAGHETTTNLIGNGVLALLRHPDQLRALKEEPGLMMSAIEELLRYDSPVQITSRVARQDLEVAGKDILKGQMVFLLLGAANHDAGQFAEPDRLDLARRDNRHLAFSHGIHSCLGAGLARLEGQVALSTILQRFPTLQLERQAMDWHRNPTIRSLKSLPVVF
jgi:cytochrome P450